MMTIELKVQIFQLLLLAFTSGKLWNDMEWVKDELRMLKAQQQQNSRSVSASTKTGGL